MGKDCGCAKQENTSACAKQKNTSQNETTKSNSNNNAGKGKIDRKGIYDTLDHLSFDLYTQFLSISWVYSMYNYIETINNTNSKKNLELSTNTYDSSNKKFNIKGDLSEYELNNLRLDIDLSKSNKIGITDIRFEVQLSNQNYQVPINVCEDIANIMNGRFINNLKNAHEDYIKGGKTQPVYKTTLSELLGSSIGEIIDNFSSSTSPVMPSTYGYIKNIFSITLGDSSINSFYKEE